jgi:cold shock CspA family protein
MLPKISMETPVAMTFRNTEPQPDIDKLVRREATKLERYGRRLVSCRMAIEEPQRHQRAGNRFRVRLEIGAGLSRPIVVTREPGDVEMHRDLRTIVLDVFRAARRQLQSSRERVRAPERAPVEPRGLVERLVPPSGEVEGYGFLRSLDGRTIYFHQNSVLNADFDRLTIGTEVRFEEEEGDEGPQASTVAIVSKPGVSAVQPSADRRRGRRRRRRATA